ncbi:hypothetical protein WKK05_04505 [Nostoc sp. UHCC 0302]|uniref:hypothetical protein n=1 Tax=Nostoc sp. UHCC 0302 TaxID=3134896 RepID=UPI00311CA05C
MKRLYNGLPVTFFFQNEITSKIPPSLGEGIKICLYFCLISSGLRSAIASDCSKTSVPIERSRFA